ncbi:MAG TPA: outer membrane beta-barrel protein [Verrucomicrobiae bacterium]|jgi:hypothetical protein|nr:outer membrane beta-barrel protein [Verrucomicrobiae bacterium]
MNRIIASVGLVALGAASVQAQSVGSAPPAKWWNVQATVRGFYDDNINANPNPSHNDRAWGYELSPKVGVAFGNDQTAFTADYKYAFLYYDHKPAGNSDHFDQDHIFNAMLTHAFTERYKIRVSDDFTIGQEPDALRNDAAFHTPYRVSGNNIVNSGDVTFNAELTPLLGVEVGYNNAWYDYSGQFNQFRNVDTNGVISASPAGALNRIEQSPHISALWHVMPETTASLSYKFTDVDYTSSGPFNDLIGGNVNGVEVRSRDRDVRSHTVYLGLDHQFRPDFYGSVQAGASYYDYYNISSTSFGPYARLSLTYSYMQDSSIQVGFQEGRTATDVVGGADAANFVHDVEASVIYASLRQRILSNFFANLNGSFQHSSFNGGGPVFNGKSENFYEFGANLEYVFNPHFSAHLGYDYDRLDSDLAGRTYDRNKVYIGATASY